MPSLVIPAVATLLSLLFVSVPSQGRHTVHLYGRYSHERHPAHSQDTLPVHFYERHLPISHERESARGVTYDGRSLIINGTRELLFSGSIHYPRSPPEMWPDLIRKAKKGGLNVIQTYVFWNVHEPVQGHFNFRGNYDLARFIQLVAEQQMYVTLRVGPFIEAEWNYGGFPYWLREVPNITFRTDNPPFKYHMERYTKMVIHRLKDANLFAPQGGPIIIAQIENEYESVRHTFKERGTRYINWAAAMAVGLNTGVPWVMCKEADAPDPVINTCNSRYCGDKFAGPNKPYKPSLWTENWTSQSRSYGDEPSVRSAEDLAFSVARFFSKNGTLVNYYMYHGGTNFGRLGSAYAKTSYYDEAPIDEYGQLNNPKWAHLRDLHAALRLCQKALLWGTPSIQVLGELLEARIYEIPGTSTCAAFLSNKNSTVPQTVKFRGIEYHLPGYSISILPDCNNVVYNTAMITAQHNARNYKVDSQHLTWEMYQEAIPTSSYARIKTRSPRDQISTTRDTTDYLWYTTSVSVRHTDLPFRKDLQPVLKVLNMGHAMHAFVNGKYAGSGHGTKLVRNFTFSSPIRLEAGLNNISLLAVMFGLPDNGAYLEHRTGGVHKVFLEGLNTGTLDLTDNGWGHKVRLTGETFRIFTQTGSQKIKWTKAKGRGPALTWYKTSFDAPPGNGPVAIKLATMSKGMAWVNDINIGRYWPSFHSYLNKTTQNVYHCPRVFLKPKDNRLVLLEEIGGDPDGVRILTVNRNTVCSIVNQTQPASVRKWVRDSSGIRFVAGNPIPKAHLKCSKHRVISKVEFASFGNPNGICGDLSVGTCSSPDSLEVVKQHCLTKNSCEVPTTNELFNKHGDTCPNVSKALAIQVRCTPLKKERHK